MHISFLLFLCAIQQAKRIYAEPKEKRAKKIKTHAWHLMRWKKIRKMPSCTCMLRAGQSNRIAYNTLMS